MRVSTFLIVAGAALATLRAYPVVAGTKVQGNLVPVDDDTNVYNIAKPGKFAFKETTAAQSGGMSIKLNLKGIDCPPNNDAGKANKCNATNNVMEVTTAVEGSDTETHTGILFNVEKGAAVFPSTGKNAVTGADVFGSIASVTQGLSLGLGTVRIRATGSAPSLCASPVLPPAGNGCNDGEKYAVSGMIPSSEPGTGPPCTSNADCDTLVPVLECVSNSCVIETCTQDSDCHKYSINPTVFCDEDAGTCCQGPSGTCDNGP